MSAVERRHHLFQSSTYITVVREGVLHVEIAQAWLFREALWCQEIPDSITRDGRDLDVAFAGQTFEVEIGQSKRHAKFDGKCALSCPAISIEFAEE